MVLMRSHTYHHDVTAPGHLTPESSSVPLGRRLQSFNLKYVWRRYVIAANPVNILRAVAFNAQAFDSQVLRAKYSK